MICWATAERFGTTLLAQIEAAGGLAKCACLRGGRFVAEALLKNPCTIEQVRTLFIDHREITAYPSVREVYL